MKTKAELNERSREYMRKRREDPEFREKEREYLRRYFQNPRVRARIKAKYHAERAR